MDASYAQIQVPSKTLVHKITKETNCIILLVKNNDNYLEVIMRFIGHIVSKNI